MRLTLKKQRHWQVKLYDNQGKKNTIMIELARVKDIDLKFKELVPLQLKLITYVTILKCELVPLRKCG